MVKSNEILEAVKRLLRARYQSMPAEAFYTNLAPSGFIRPSFLIETGPRTMVSAGYATVEVEAQVIVTAFTPVDKLRNSHVEALEERTMEVQMLFMGGKLAVGAADDPERRALDIESVTADVGFDYGEVTVVLRYLDDRGEEWAELPLMEDIYINTTTKE